MSSTKTGTRSTDETIVVAGGGQAGGWAVQTLRREGFDGRIVLISEEKYAPYERPPLSKGLLAGKQTIEQCLLKPENYYETLEIELRLSVSVTDIDLKERNVVLSSGEILGYNSLLLATGARVRKLAIKGGDLAGICYLRTIDEALALRRRFHEGARVVLVGGGFIGLEVAATARSLGCSVSLLELQPRLMARVVPPEISAYFRRIHEERGVKIHAGIAVTKFERDDNALQVHCTDGRVITADIVVVGVGVQANTELAERAGIETQDGILIDEYGRTSDPHVFAAGDVARHFNPLLGRHVRLESWQNAQNQAIAVAQTMCGKPQPYAEVPWFWSDQYDLNIQLIGLPDTWDEIIFRGSVTENRFLVFYVANQVVVGGIAVNNARDLRFVRKLILERQPVKVTSLADPDISLKSLS